MTEDRHYKWSSEPLCICLYLGLNPRPLCSRLIILLQMVLICFGGGVHSPSDYICDCIITFVQLNTKRLEILLFSHNFKECILVMGTQNIHICMNYLILPYKYKRYC